jgi:beta-1,4-N-acetylglucosaminyltransferase
MLRLLSGLPDGYYPRLYLVAVTDSHSRARAEAFEQGGGRDGAVAFADIPRAREVGQGVASALVSTLLATLKAAPVILRFSPDVVLVNGPGTCLPVCALAFFLRVG